MTQATHLITAVAIFVHAVVGCCAHQAHGARLESIACCHGAQGEDACHEHMGEAQLPADSSFALDCTRGHHARQPLSHECRHANCQWIPLATRECVNLILPGFVASIPSFLQSTSDFSWVGRRDLSAAWRSSFSRAMPVRAHLVKCVLLI
jgi:hypothetical protein